MRKTMLKTFGVVVGSGFVLASVGWLITWGLTKGDHCAGLFAFLVAFWSYPVGLIIGIILVNRLFHYDGSLLFGILGFILGGVLGGVIMFFLDTYLEGTWLTSPILITQAFIQAFVIVPLFVTLGYCLFKKGTGTAN